MVFVMPIYSYIKMGSLEIWAIKQSEEIKPYLAHPESMKIDSIVNINVDMDGMYFTNSDGEVIVEADEAKKAMGNFPILTYVIYTAKERDELGGERVVEEIFALLDGEPLTTSVGVDDSASIKVEYLDKLTPEDDIRNIAVYAIFSDWLDIVQFGGVLEDQGYFVNEVDKYDMLVYKYIAPYYAVLFSIIVIAIALVFWRKGRLNKAPGAVKAASSNGAGFAVIESTVESICNEAAFPADYETYKVDNKNCGVWIQSGVLHIHQTQKSLLNKLKKNAEKYNSPAVIRKSVYCKKIDMRDISGINLNEDNSYAVQYKGNEINFAPEAHDFLSKIKARLRV
jgi:hypothetical protein